MDRATQLITRLPAITQSDFALLSDAVPVDAQGQPISCLMDADDVCGYRFGSVLLHRHTSNIALEQLAEWLCEASAETFQRYYAALSDLREELRMQPER